MCIKFLPNFAALGDRSAEDRDASVRFIAMPFWTTVILQADRQRNRLIYRALVTLLATRRITFPRWQPINHTRARISCVLQDYVAVRHII